jgi:opacity protein-like surface antigen
MFSLIVVPKTWAAAHAFLGDLSRAKGNIKLGDILRVHLGLKVQETWDDNIFNTAEEEKEDLISTLTPGLLFSMGDRYKFEIGYAIDMHAYSDYTDEDYTNQAAMAGMDLNFAGGLKLDVSDRYTDTKDVRPEVGQERSSHISNTFKAGAKYPFPGKKLTVGLNYSQFYLKYDQEENKETNRSDDTPGVFVHYKFLPKMSLALEYTYTNTDYFDSEDESTDADSVSQRWNVGLFWDATAKLSGKLSTGWSIKEYDNSEDSDGNEYSDEDIWAVSVALGYKVTEKTSLSLRILRSLEETTYSGDNVAGEVSGASHYTNTGGKLGILQKLDPKVTLSAGVGYNEHEYNNLESGFDTRRDDIIDFNIGLDYDIRNWLSAGIGYSFSETDSNDEDRDERHSKAFVSIAAAF